MKKTPGTLYKILVLSLLSTASWAQIRSVVNAASFVQNTSLTPGSIITILGTNLAQTTAQATSPGSLPKTLGGVSVTVGGIASDLFYVSPTQVNAQIDPTVPAGQRELRLTSPAGTYTANLTIAQAGAPGIFSMSGTGTRDGAILNAITFARGPFSVTTGGNPTFLAIYTTGLDLSAPPRVTIQGVQLPVQYAGAAPGFAGLQQINVQLLPSLAGAGRVEVAVTAGGRTSNIVETVILPNPGQGGAPDEEHTQRNRELASIAWVPGGSLALLADENDDVVRVLDISKRTVIATINLPEGSEPVAIAVNAAGTRAVVAEREHEKAAIIDIPNRRVLQAVTVGRGPSSVAIAGDLALVVNQDSDSVTILNVNTGAVTATVAVGRGPRSVAVNPATGLAYVTDQDEGNVRRINPATGAVTATWPLGAEARPFAIQVVPALNLALVTEPSSHEEGMVVLLNLETGLVTGAINVNPDKSGGASEIAVFGNTAYFANQSGGSVTMVRFTAVAPLAFTTANVKAELGARALAIDETDRLLLVTNQGSGNVVLIDLATNRVVGRINGVRGEREADEDRRDDREDREQAGNAPVITSMTPGSARAGTSFAMQINGRNLTGATQVLFLDPDSMPGQGQGRGRGQENRGNHGHGPFGTPDRAFTVTNIVVNPAGTQLTANIALTAQAAKGERVVRVVTPNGESTMKESAANTFRVQ